MYGELCHLAADSAADMADYLAANRTMNKARKAGYSRCFAKKKCIQIAGPLLPIVLPPGVYSSHHPLGKGQNILALAGPAFVCM